MEVFDFQESTLVVVEVELHRTVGEDDGRCLRTFHLSHAALFTSLLEYLEFVLEVVFFVSSVLSFHIVVGFKKADNIFR